MRKTSQEDRLASIHGAPSQNSVFDISCRFLQSDEADRALALESLFASIRSIPEEVSDPGVGMAKLAWWQKEVMAAREAGSQHPIVQNLLESDVLENWNKETWTGYIAGVASELNQSTINNMAELESRLKATAGLETLLWCEAMEADSGAPMLMAVGAAGRLLSILNTWVQTGGECIHLPLNLVARHGLILDPGNQDSGSAKEQLVASMAESGLAWLGSEGMNSPDQWNFPGPGKPYWLISTSLVNKHLRQIVSRPDRWLHRSKLGRIGDVFTAWNTARQCHVVS